MLTASTATGQLVFLPLLAHLAQTVGWRTVSLTLAAISAALILPVLALLRDRPSDLGIPPYGGRAVVPRAVPATNPAVRAIRALGTGLRSRDFWLLGGIPEVAAAGLLAAMGVFDMVGTTLSGWLSDRWDNRMLLAWYYGLRGLSLLFLPFAFDIGLFGFTFAGLSLFAVFYGLDWIATVPPTVRLTARCFGEENAPVMFGWIAAMHQLGAACAAWLAGFARVETGSYLVAFMGAGALCFVASVMVAFIGARPRPVAAAV